MKRFMQISSLVAQGGSAVAFAQPIFPMTQQDFKLPGTQLNAVSTSAIIASSNCIACHGGASNNDPSSSWTGSLMGQAGRDPLFFAQMSLANQDVANVGTFCLRCHVPGSYVTGHAAQADGSTLDAYDKDGVSCNFCHSMVDPIARPGAPAADAAILAALGGPGVPQHYGNAMFVLDPTGLRRGPRIDGSPFHAAIYAQFQKSANMCGTCHEVGNIATIQQPNGLYTYNALNTPSAETNPDHLFPLERTFSEWKLSAFANGGVDLGGRFGGIGVTTVSSCQDCHMPRVAGHNSPFGPHRGDMAKHEFAGAAAQVLDIIMHYTQSDPDVDQDLLNEGRARSVSMLERAASLKARQQGGSVILRVTNESGHKLPTGHIEGRRVWVNTRFYNSVGELISEHGHYDHATAELTTSDTTVFEMHVGLDSYAAGLTGLPAGETAHMSLANMIVKDNRIPPRGFSNAAFNNAAAPVVGAAYADGQHWADVPSTIPVGAVEARMSLYYQNTPKEYIEHLRDANHTDSWGVILYNAWAATGQGAPIEMSRLTFRLVPPFCPADIGSAGGVATPDTLLDNNDFVVYIDEFFARDPRADIGTMGGIEGQDDLFDNNDFIVYIDRFFSGCH